MEQFLLDHLLPYLSHWQPYVLIGVTMVMNNWMIDLVEPTTHKQLVWLIRINSVFMCIMLSWILFGLDLYNLYAAIGLGLMTPYIYKLGHAVLLWRFEGLAKGIEKASGGKK